MFEKNCLEGQAGIITGGSSGIGLGMAVELAKHGAKLTITGRNEEKLKKAAQFIKEESSSPYEVLTCQGDVRKKDQVEQNLKDHKDHHQKVDFLINNAAGNFLCSLEKMSENAFQSVMGIVTHGTFLWSKAVLESMKEQKRGNIINIGAHYALSGGPWVAHSGAAKAAVLNLTKSQAAEWGPYGINSNMIIPGPIEETEGIKRLMPDSSLKESFKKLIPLQRMGKTSDVAALAIFLLTPLGSYINGAAIPVDGGISLTTPGLLPYGIDVEKFLS
jgi:NAD(P)-dependent dehydrogenase (short-subunit alcohol dehydrogenase family)